MKAMIEYLESGETPAKCFPWSSSAAKQLYEHYLADRKKELYSQTKSVGQ